MSGIVYFGIEKMGLTALRALFAMEKEIACVYTFPETKRESIVAYESFDEFCLSHAIKLRKIESANDPKVIREIESCRPDIIYIVGWSELIRRPLLEIPPKGCIGFHGTLLPRHRGRAPIPWSIIFGLRKSGMSMFYLTPGVDNGLLIDQDEYIIETTDYASDVYEKSCASVCRLIERNHLKIVGQSIEPRRQDERFADTWPKRLPRDGIIDWNKNCSHLYDWIRALSHPFPGAFTYFENKKLLVWRSRIADRDKNEAPGSIVGSHPDHGPEVACGQGTLFLTRVQWEGEKEMTAGEAHRRFRHGVRSFMDF